MFGIRGKDEGRNEYCLPQSQKVQVRQEESLYIFKTTSETGELRKGNLSVGEWKRSGDDIYILVFGPPGVKRENKGIPAWGREWSLISL